MRVAFDVGPVRAEPAGVGFFATSMANALAADLGADHLVLIGRREGLWRFPPEIPATRLATGMYWSWLQVAAPYDVKRTRADVAHFSQGMVPLVRAARTVVSVHDMSLVRLWRTHPVRRLSQVPLVLLSPRTADVVVVPSRATADEVMLLTGAPARKIHVMPYAPQDQISPVNQVSVEATLRRHALSRHAYIVALGTLEPRKNQIRLIEAFETAVAQNDIQDDVELVLIGKTGWRAQPVLARLSRSPQRNKIRHLGYLGTDDLYPLLSAAAAVAFVSLYEGFGLPVVEAMACGAPTVTSKVSSMPEVAGDAGFLVNPFDSADIARGLAEAVHAGATHRHFVASRSIAQASQFSWERTARSAVALYRSLV